MTKNGAAAQGFCQLRRARRPNMGTNSYIKGQSLTLSTSMRKFTS